MVEIGELLDSYGREQAVRIANLNRLNETLIPKLGNKLWVNGVLSARDHNELMLQERVELTPLNFVPTPTNQNHIGRFGYGFEMTAGYERLTSDPSDTRERRVPIDIQNLSELAASRVHIHDLHRFNDHRSRPAFYRALNLAPGFIVNLTAEISSGTKPLSSFGPEILLAYRIMANLVDARDPHAIKASGRPNRSYLFGLTPAQRPRRFTKTVL